MEWTFVCGGYLKYLRKNTYVVQCRVVRGVVEVDKEITKLDEFVLDALSVIKKHADYVIISGYVSIFFGRARATEDVDIFIRNVSREEFKKLYDESVKRGYEWTIDAADELYGDYLKENLPVSMWKKNFPLLRIEMKLAHKFSQLLAFKDRIIVKFKGNEIFIGNIEQQIAYKRYIAKSDKDLADAKHLELVFAGLSMEKIKQYKQVFEEEFYGLH